MSDDIAQIDRREFKPLAEAILESSDSVAIFTNYRDKHFATAHLHADKPLNETLIDAIAHCLNHDNFKIGANAAVILRENVILCSRACDLDALVSALTTQLNDRRIQPAKEAALAIAFFLSTRPSDSKLPQWGGSDPMTSTTMETDLDQHRFIEAPVDSGFLERLSQTTVEEAVDALIKNLNRKEYKRSKDWGVSKECAKAIGAIGYQRPDIVVDAVPEILDILGEQDERQAWLVYALTSIGYSRPDLLPPEFASRLKEFSEEAGWGVGWQLETAAKVGHRKIGHAPQYLEKAGCNPEVDLSEVVEKLYKFMLGRYPSAHDEVVQAFVEIYLCRSDDLVKLLKTELDQILEGNTRAFDFPDNFSYLLKQLAGVDVESLAPLMESSKQFYQDHSQSHYWYENALEFHRLIAVVDEDILPNDMGDIVTDFVKPENRHSVQIDARRFLKEIDQWEDELFSTLSEEDQVAAISEFVEEIDIEILTDEDGGDTSSTEPE